MADFSNVNGTVSLPVTMPVFPYIRDHFFEDRTVLPAVEAIRLLSTAVKEFAPGSNISVIQDVRFDKFLVIPCNVRNIEAQCRLTVLENSRIEAVLLTKTRIAKAGFNRIKEHARAIFCLIRPPVRTDRLYTKTFGKENSMMVTRTQIYSQLVPFGPAYQNIDSSLRIYNQGVVANLLDPDISDATRGPSRLGSPFILDAAFHSACVWGQRFCGVVAFPVGIGTRVVIQPTQPGQRYTAHVFPIRTTQDNLAFDIGIFDKSDHLHEVALDVHMRDISAGRMRPPEWIRKGVA